jgi:hypothetical protein
MEDDFWEGFETLDQSGRIQFVRGDVDGAGQVASGEIAVY